ncbi:hypothetical protein VP01_1789g8 [Puccinia sorghi]|uniref:Retrovirus-related Pol polyprotein from transposon TNT 1-94-like beta-barrel domain-containing protein n=1 Tax=Puccinia sorghi TaxID=27349 RepID=A0A0L6VF33_9BASI|nr:hypothetical protein VP01_1789g8 [Puccinia sorghi]
MTCTHSSTPMKLHRPILPKQKLLNLARRRLLEFCSSTWDDPRKMWIKLESHYQSKAIANQAKVYNDFLAFKFKGTDIDQFIADLTSHISCISSVGLRIGIPKDFEIHENLFCESILDKIPSSLIHTREVLIQNRPLTIEKLTDLLENRRRDDTTIRVKTEESAMKAISRSSNSNQARCSNGEHNPESNHSESQCFELHPEQKAKMKERRAKAKAKAKKAAIANDDSSGESFAWHCVKRAQIEKLKPNTAYLDGGASHHMVSDREHFSTYTEVKCNIELADGKSTISPGVGTVYLKTESGEPLKLECLHVPHLVGNLISEGRLFRRGMDKIRTGPLTANLMHEGQIMFKVKLSDADVFLMKFEVVKKGKSFPAANLSKSKSDVEMLHRRAGHPSDESLKRMYGLTHEVRSL